MKKLFIAFILASITTSQAIVSISVDFDAQTITLVSTGDGLNWFSYGGNLGFGANNGSPDNGSGAIGGSATNATFVSGASSFGVNTGTSKVVSIDFRVTDPLPSSTNWVGTATANYDTLSAYTLNEGTWTVGNGSLAGSSTLSVTVVPEPSTYLMTSFLGLGTIGFLVLRRRQAAKLA